MELSKHKFNMVEIVLALSVVAIAIVSLMGMLPVALRASKNSVADNSVTSTVEIMKSFVDSKYRTNTSFSSFQNEFVSSKPDDADATVLAYSDTNQKYPSTSTDLENYAFQITNGNTAGTFRVELFSGAFESDKFAVTDFDADVRMWREKIKDIYVPYDPKSTNAVNTFIITNEDTLVNHGTTICVEVSWPGGVKYENQEHRLYKFDYFAK